MERFRKFLLPLVCALVALSARAPVGAAGAGVDTAALKKITSRLDVRTGVVAIEASDPVPYVTSQPDPKTFVVELRDVVAAAVTHPVQADPRNPFTAVAVENAVAADGARVARVQLTLSAAVRPRVRSARNIIYVEADRLDTDTPSAGTVTGIGPTTTIKDILVQPREGATAVTLRATGPIVPADLFVPKDGPRRLVMNLANVSSAVVSPVIAGQGRCSACASASARPRRSSPKCRWSSRARRLHRIETSADKNELTVVFDSPLSPAAPVRKPATITPVPAAGGRCRRPPRPPPRRYLRPRRRRRAVRQRAGRAAESGALHRPPGQPGLLGRRSASVLRTFAEISGLNIVIDPTIQGTVDVSLRDVPWDQALDIILRANRLGYSVDGTIVRIAPLTVLADEETQRRKLSDEQALAGELRVMTRALSYARAEDLRALLTATALSQRGSIQTDARTNTMIINDLPERLERAAALLTTLDVPQPQVEIEARIVQTNRSFANSLGVKWNVQGNVNSALGNSLPVAFPNNGAVGAGVNLAEKNATSTASLALGAVNGALNLDVALSALEKTGQGPHPLHAAGLDAEQHRGRDHAGYPDSDSDDREQHRDGVVPRCRAHAEGHAADYRGGHRDHAHQRRQRVARFQPPGQRHPADRHPARRHAGAGERRRDHRHRRHLHQPRAEHAGADASALSAPAPRLAVQEEHRRGREPRAAHLPHPEDRQAAGSIGLR
jgi:hypothetical protein